MARRITVAFRDPVHGGDLKAYLHHDGRWECPPVPDRPFGAEVAEMTERRLNRFDNPGGPLLTDVARAAAKHFYQPPAPPGMPSLPARILQDDTTATGDLRIPNAAA